MKPLRLGLIALGLAAMSVAVMPATAAEDHHGGGHRDGKHHGGGAAHRPKPLHHRPSPPHHGNHRPNQVHHHVWHRPVVRPGHGWHGGRHWAKGQRFNYRYAPNYRRIDDWRSYRGLYAPPRGYYWARSGDDAVLVALTGGLIAAVIAGSIH